MLSDFVDDNAKWVKWFEEDHKPKVQQCLRENGFQWGNVLLTGSRSFNLAYHESDLEFAIVVDDQTQDDAKMDILRAIEKFYRKTQFSTDILVIKTKAGLPLLISKNTSSKMWKVEITVRTETQQQTIVEHINKQLETWDDAKKLDYIVKMCHAFKENNEELMLHYKQWLKVLKKD